MCGVLVKDEVEEQGSGRQMACAYGKPFTRKTAYPMIVQTKSLESAVSMKAIAFSFLSSHS